MKNIKDYKVEDFIADDRFIKWVKSPNEDISKFWAEFIRQHPQKADEIQEAKQILLSIEIVPVDVEEETIGRLRQRINQQIDHPSLTISGKSASIKPKTSRYFWIAASVTGLLLMGVAWLISYEPGDQADPVVNVKKEFNMNHLEEQVIPRGKRLMITLQDGSRVWLNADTKLEYAKDFQNKGTRDVYLIGEAFFDVVEDKKRPFIVHTQDVEIKVLGTSFNVKAYSKETRVETTLVKGKVSIEHQTADDKITLIPNQRAVYEKEAGKVVVENNIETETYTSWKSGILTFDDQPFNEIIPVLERWFNVSIHTENAASLECRFTAKINNKTLEEVLELFKTSDTISYDIEGSEVHIYGNFCE